ncbi:MAG: hypothetical protein ACREBW_01960 [Candidatus Micrarchaeaceae archaeon]
MIHCETCGGAAIAVLSVPGVPYSTSYCSECIEANAHPWKILTANTACIGSYEESSDWWKEMVQATCKRLGKTLEEFKQDVVKEGLAFNGDF